MSHELNRHTPPKLNRKKEESNWSGGAEREGGDDSLANSSPTDSRSDEKVVVNEQRSNKTVNAPSQTAVNTSEGNSNDEEIVE